MAVEKESRTHLRGFASMSAERRKEIASLGGKAAHERGTAFRWDREQAREAGKKGGSARRTTSTNS